MAQTALVTGAAGFIGSRLSHRLVEAGWSVRGVDSFTDYYPRDLKQRNLLNLDGETGFEFREVDLSTANPAEVIGGVDVVYHLAGQPGVRASWGETFEGYVRDNVLVTQRLLEAVAKVRVQRFVFASSSSVYGNASDLPTTELTLPRPISPYGVTKLAAEQLCSLYGEIFNVPTVSLRYFTVYGPGQRPDMAFQRFLSALANEQVIRVNGDGEQTRDFTYVDDIVAGNIAAGHADTAPGAVYNLGGGSRVTVNEVLGIMREVTGIEPRIQYGPEQPGDARDTSADTSRARSDLGFTPMTTLTDGIEQQWRWLQRLAELEAG